MAIIIVLLTLESALGAHPPSPSRSLPEGENAALSASHSANQELTYHHGKPVAGNVLRSSRFPSHYQGRATQELTVESRRAGLLVRAHSGPNISGPPLVTERGSRSRSGRGSSRRREPRHVWEERGAKAELPLLGGGGRSQLQLASWLLAPILGLLLLACCRPVAAILDEVPNRYTVL